MTPPRSDRRHGSMVLGAGAIALAIPLGSGGCGKSPPPPPPPAPVVQARPLAPLEDLEMDPRVQFPEARAPSSREVAEAIAEFASALVSGDDRTLSEMMDEGGNAVLTQLKTSGQWKSATSRIEAVRVCTLTEREGAGFELGLGVQDPDGAYLLAWSGARSGESYSFSPMPVADVRQASLAQLDDAAIVAPLLPRPAVVEIPLPPKSDDDD